MMKYLYLMSLMIFASSSFANGDDKAGPVTEFSCYKNIVCAAHGDSVDFIDWIDIRHPKRLSCLQLKSHNDKKVLIHSIAMSDGYAYLAVGNIGISVVDIHDLSRPREIRFIEKDYAESFGTDKVLYSNQSILLRKGLLFVTSDFITKDSKILLIFDIVDPSQPKPIDLSDPYLKPITDFFEYTKSDEDGKLSNFGEEPDGNGYYISISNEKLNVWIFDKKKRAITRLVSQLTDIDHATYEDPAVKVDGHEVVVTFGNRMWLVDIDDVKILCEKDFDSKIKIEAFKGGKILLSDRESDEDYYFIDRKNMDVVIPWSHKNGKEFVFRNGAFLLVRDESAENASDSTLRQFNVSDLNSIREVPLPFSDWGKSMDYMFQLKNGLLGMTYTSESHHSKLGIADFKDNEHPKIRGVINDVAIGGCRISGDRFYFLDIRSTGITDGGLLSVIDLSNQDKIGITGVYDINGN